MDDGNQIPDRDDFENSGFGESDFEDSGYEDFGFDSAGGRGEGSWETEVPRILHSEYSGGPFRTCLVCSTPLADAEMHIVEKVIRGGEAVMEMALCLTCAGHMTRDCSEESLEKLKEVQEGWVENADPEGEHCAGCGRMRDHADAFVIAGYFLPGYELVRRMTVCETCHETVQKMLSQKTREAFGAFIEQHFPGVPEFLDSPILFG